jgi:pyruvate formate lyase activating enzyme
MREAMFYSRQDDGTVQCLLCEHRCAIAPQAEGRCGVRVNSGGTLQARTYGRAAAVNLDPIEKKPLYHFLPGSLSLSIGTLGCNFDCTFCQNWELSHPAALYSKGPGLAQWGDERLGIPLSPSALAERALREGAGSLSFTYNEPTTFTEYALDSAAVARRQGLRSVFVTNGYFTPEVLQELTPLVDAMNIDLKSLREEFYQRQCHARLKPVLENIERAVHAGVWVEVTTLVIHGLNDSRAELKQVAEFLVSVSPDLPWHLSAFHPDFRMLDRPRTPTPTLAAAYDIGKAAGLRHVYTGNVQDSARSTTYCPSCGMALVERGWHSLSANNLAGGACPQCGSAVAGVWA